MIMNRPELFQVIERVTGCAPIGNFFGRIHRSHSSSTHQISWHGDNADHRLIGISINLSTESYSGGFFQLREKDSENVLSEIGAVGLGSAFLFRIAPAFQHRLMPIDAGGNRTVGVGWFRAFPDWPTFARNYFLTRFSPTFEQATEDIHKST